MTKTADLLIAEARWVAHMATIAIVALVIAMMLVLGTSFLPLPEPEDPVSTVIGVLLGVSMLSGMVAMIGSTIKALALRHRSTDSGLFLLLVWLVPIVGVASYLGTKNLRRGRVRR